MGGTLAALNVIDTGDRFDLYIVDCGNWSCTAERSSELAGDQASS
jgi:hypothetical protein